MRVVGHAARTMQYLQHFGRNISTAFTSDLKCQIIKLSFEHSTNNPVHCGGKRFCLSQDVHTDSGAHPSSYSMSTSALS